MWFDLGIIKKIKSGGKCIKLHKNNSLMSLFSFSLYNVGK